MPFACSICEEESTRICVRCTKDTCSNHLCDKCGCCSDCCGCEVPLDDHNHMEPMHVETVHPQPVYAEPIQAEQIQAESEPLHRDPEPLHPAEPTPEEILHVEPPRPDSEPQPPHPPPDPDPIPEDGPEPEPGPLVA